MNDKNLELIPDKDGFLFEIEDHSYLLENFVSWLFVVFTILGILFIFFDGDILAMKNEGHRGYLLIIIGIPLIVFESAKMLIYIIKKKKDKIQFYTNYIYKVNKNIKLPLCDIEEGYISKYNIKGYRVRLFNGYLMSIGLILAIIFYIWALTVNLIGVAIIISIIIICLLFVYLMGIFIYSLLKTKKKIYQTNSLILIDKRNAKYGISIPLNIISKEEKQKIDNYIKQYLHTDINKIEKIFLNVPFFVKKNIEFDKIFLEG